MRSKICSVYLVQDFTFVFLFFADIINEPVFSALTVTMNSNSNTSDLCAPYNQIYGAFQSSHSVPGVNSMKQKTLQFAVE